MRIDNAADAERSNLYERCLAEGLKILETGGEISPESEAVFEQLKALGYVEE